ncbi:MAG: DUF1501 domain-containing protein [Actinobacteria bacterium]|nr:DUF1501 domain-containing protein [Actinomycetota bacterium]
MTDERDLDLSRRSFVGLAAGGALAGAAAWAGLVESAVAAGAEATAAGKVATDRVLVVVQEGGGNDGLNTVVPITGRYHDLRPTLGLADSSLVRLTGETGYGLHPSLKPLAALWGAKQLSIVQGVGYPDNSRSHFQALDSWWSATPGRAATTGWLGRWLDATSTGADPLRAVSIGGGNPALRAARSPSTAIVDPAGFSLAAPPGVSAAKLAAALVRCASPVEGGGMRAAAQRAIATASDVAERVAAADLDRALPAVPADAGSGEYVAGDVTAGLQVAANLIAANLGTRVIVVNAGGFDTHANQATTHRALLADLGGGIARFQQAVAKSGQAARVLLVTTSEFGRRARENGSGTDHGNGGTHLVVGPGVKGSIVGTPNLAKLDPQGDVAASIDVRSLYAIALSWLGGPVDEVLGRSWDTYGVLR